jgi:hypothetical protein
VWSAVALSLAACQGKLLRYQGRLVPEERRIGLQMGGPHEATWKTYDLSMDYRYSRTAGTIDMSGDIRIRWGPILNNFSFEVHFLDESGRILQSHVLALGGSGRPEQLITFNKRLPIAQETRLMAFSYAGSFSGTGDAGAPSTFWQTP